MCLNTSDVWQCTKQIFRRFNACVWVALAEGVGGVYVCVCVGGLGLGKEGDEEGSVPVRIFWCHTFNL